MWYSWLVHRPVVEWWVGYWVLELNVIVVDTIDDDIFLSKIFIAFHTISMWYSWLVYGPVVEWRVGYWVRSLDVSNVFINTNLHLLAEWYVFELICPKH